MKHIFLLPYNKVYLKSILILCILLFSINGASSAKSTAKKALINFTATDIKVASLFEILENKTGYLFVYKESDINTDRKVSVDYNQKNIDEILDDLCTELDFSYTVKGSNIIIQKERSSQQPKLDRINIRGRVLDKEQQPLIGVSVVIKGQESSGTITDIDGFYNLNSVPKNGSLTFSYIGYKAKTIAIKGQPTLNCTLEEDSQELEELIVVGYGTQQKVNLTGAVSSITSEDMKDRPVNQLSQLLQGAIPNLNVTVGSGKPGSSGSLNIRGNTSINGGSPLILIDGVIGTLDRINPNDVESVSVLKDASASAVYGARAAFGVVLVTTKKGKEGKFNIKYNGSFGVAKHNTNTDFITSGYWNAKINDEAMYNALGYGATKYSEEDYEELWARVNDKTEHPDRPWVVVKKNNAGRDMYRYYGNFDWFNYLYDDSRPRQSHNVTVSGGSEKVNYYLSGAYSREQGIFNIRPDYNTRQNTRTRVEANPFKWLTISNNTHFFRSNYTWHGFNTNFPTVTNNVSSDAIYHYLPVFVPRNPDGTLTGYGGISSYPIGYGLHNALESGTLKGYNKGTELLTKYEVILRPVKGLTLTGNYTYREHSGEYQYRQTKQYYSKYPGVMELSSQGSLKTDRLNETMTKYYWNFINFYANYDFSIKDHNFSAMFGYNQDGRNYKRLHGDGQELLSETINDLNLVTGEQRTNGGGDQWRTRGVFGRINYNYLGKYLFEISGRYDGTSRFPKDDRFGFFPSFSLGWRLSEEAFFKSWKEYIDNVKIRFSHGTLGNQEVGVYAYIPTMNAGTINYLVNGEKLNTINHPSPVARSLTWETITTKNLGFDFGVFQNRLNFSADIYQRDTKDMLTKGKTLPSVFGAGEPKENAANMRTRGFEVSLSWSDKFLLGNKPFSYSVSAILSDYTAKITKFDNPTKLLSDHYEGKRLGEIWGYSYDGFFKTTEEAQEWAKIVNQDKINKRRVQAPTEELRMLQAGDIKILDLDGSGVIDTGANTLDNPGDRRIIGNSQPRYSYGFNLSAQWNGIDLSMLFQGIGRQHWYPHRESQMFWHVYARPYDSFIPKNFKDMMWSEENPNAYFPFIRGYTAQNSELSVANDMYLQNIAYCKLRNLTIGYSLPRVVLDKIRLDRVRVYLSGENLFTWTKLDTKYLDPESVTQDPTGRAYPMSKILSVGLDITF